MHNKSRLVYSRCQSAASWANRRERERKTRGTQRESSGSRVSKDEEIRWRWKLNNRQPPLQLLVLSTSLSLICPSCLDLRSFMLSLSIFQQFLPTIAAHSILSIRAYLSVVLPHLQLSLLSWTSWCSSTYCSRRVSESVSPPTPAVGDQPLSCQMMLRVALPLSSLSVQPSPFSSPPLPHTHACI